VEQLSTQTSVLSVSSGDLYQLSSGPSSGSLFQSPPMEVQPNRADDDATMEDDGPTKPKTSRATVNIFDEKLVAAFDRCGVTDRNAVFLLNATCEALHALRLLTVGLDELVINRSSIRRFRQEIREYKYEALKNEFKDLNLESIVVHWDGKMLPDLLNTKTADRLPIVVSSGEVEFLLGVPELENSSGIEQATNVHEMLIDWGIADNVKALCCDTTSSNLGHLNGAAVNLEKLLKRDLLYLPCRHHIFELILRAAFETFIPKSTAPSVKLFDNFSKEWTLIDKSKYKTGLEDEQVRNVIGDKIDTISGFAREKLKESLPRDDYKELLELVLVFIGKGPLMYNFRKPGACSNARWMAKAIYAIKMFLFREQLSCLDNVQQGKLRDLCIFLAAVYVKAWFMAPYAINAPNHDLMLVKELYNYQKINRAIADAALKKIAGHLWYLSPELAVVSIFDDAVPVDTKSRIALTLKTEEDRQKRGKSNSEDEDVSSEHYIKRFKSSTMENLLEVEIDYFVNEHSLRFFQRFNLKTDFLDQNPVNWPTHRSYLDGLAVVRQLKVVNDCAERSVKLIKDFRGKFTKDERQLQYVLQMVQAHRKNVK
jgi:hypothetical protein